MLCLKLKQTQSVTFIERNKSIDAPHCVYIGKAISQNPILYHKDEK